MNLTKTLKLISTPLFLGAGIFVFIFVVFTTTYSFFEYRTYLSSYQTNQQVELTAVRKRTEATLKKVDELLQLTNARIAASKDDLQRIQNILISAHRLYTPQELPNIQSVAYYVFSQPYRVISRFGVVPLGVQEPRLSSSTSKEPSIDLHDNTIIGKVHVFDERQILKGILEIKIASSEFKVLLGKMRTISFIPLGVSQTPLLQKLPIALFEKPPDPFWDFASAHKSRYAVFFFYTLVVFLVFFCCVFFLHWYFQMTYGGKIESLKQRLKDATEKGEEDQEKLTISDQKYKSCSTSFQAYKKIYANLNRETKEQTLQICNGLDAVIQGFKGGKVYHSTAQQFEILQSCAKFAHLLSEGRILQKRTEEINLADLFNAVLALFADKMHKSKTTIDLICLDTLCFYGDLLFTELLLMNVIGKAIYRLSRNGKVVITVHDQGETLCFELRYKGFVADDISAEAFKKSFDLFISENILKKMCHENGIQYISLRDGEAFNITRIILPQTPLEESSDNIIKLFK